MGSAPLKTMNSDCEPEKLDRVFRYQQQTKHGYHRFADGPGYLDWINQPDPFRRYQSSELISMYRKISVSVGIVPL